jgi:hypothetical protein
MGSNTGENRRKPDCRSKKWIFFWQATNQPRCSEKDCRGRSQAVGCRQESGEEPALIGAGSPRPFCSISPTGLSNRPLILEWLGRIRFGIVSAMNRATRFFILVILLAVLSPLMIAATNTVTLDEETRSVLREISAMLANTNPPMLNLDSETRQRIREATKEKSVIKEVAPTVLGGALAALTGILANYFTHWLQARERTRQEAEFKRNVLSAFKRELQGLGAIYEDGNRLQCKGISTRKAISCSFGRNPELVFRF